MAGDTSAAPALGTDGFPLSVWAPPAAPPQAGPTPAPAPPQVGSAAAAAPAAPKRAAAVRDLSGRPQTEVYDLLWPKAVDDVEIRQVVMKRMSTGEVAAFVDRLRNAGEEGEKRFPIFFRVDGASLSDDEWDAFDPDDTDALSEKADRFLPARFRMVKPSDGSSQAAPDTTGNSSAR